jgi:hypothetical protein
MRIKVWMDSNASTYSKKDEIIDLEKDWNITDEEWYYMTDEEKFKFVEDWAWNNDLEIGYIELNNEENG